METTLLRGVKMSIDDPHNLFVNYEESDDEEEID